MQSDAEILAVIRESSDTIHHAAGTNRMGLTSDPLAVVDSKGMLSLRFSVNAALTDPFV